MELSIYKLLQKNEQYILSQWQSAVLNHAPKDLLIGNKPKGQFTAPVFYMIEKNTAAILKWLIKAADDNDLFEPLEEICRLRAVQNNKPSEALGFIFVLKQIIRESLARENLMRQYAVELGDVDERVDEIARQAFDFYCACQTQIYELRVNEIKRMYGRDAG